jgi:molybdenum cofactor cytidylyltransferase
VATPSRLCRDFSVVILAAGLGTRMGRAQSKLLLPWRDGRPILWHAVRNALELGPLEVLVVVRPDLPELEDALADLPIRCVPNPRYMEGMASSLLVGLEGVSEGAEGMLLLLGDEPEVPAHIVERLAQAHEREQKPVTVPRYGEQIGPPTLFSRAAFPLLRELTGDAGARHLIARNPELVTYVPFEASDRPRDVDTPADLRDVRQ